MLKNLEYVPRVIVTDKLGSYQVAHRELLASVEHRRSKYFNIRIENSHQPTRQRERAMKRFTSPGHAQRFWSALRGISPHFRPGRHRLTAPEWRSEMADRFHGVAGSHRDRRCLKGEHRTVFHSGGSKLNCAAPLFNQRDSARQTKPCRPRMNPPDHFGPTARHSASDSVGFDSGGVGVNEGRRQLRDGVGQGVFGVVGDPVGLGEADRGIDVEFGVGVDAVADPTHLDAAHGGDAGFGGQGGFGGVDEVGVYHIEQAPEHVAHRSPQDGQNRDGDEQPDDGVGQREAQRHGQFSGAARGSRSVDR
jgi:DDE domain